MMTIKDHYTCDSDFIIIIILMEPRQVSVNLDESQGKLLKMGKEQARLPVLLTVDQPGVPDRSTSQSDFCDLTSQLGFSIELGINVQTGDDFLVAKIKQQPPILVASTGGGGFACDQQDLPHGELLFHWWPGSDQVSA